MTLNKAIHRNKVLKSDLVKAGRLVTAEAVQLGIEALERELILRHEIPYDRAGLLPSETEE